MKNLKNIFFFFIMTAFLASCDSDLEKVMIDETLTVSSLKRPAEADGMEFVKANAADSIIYTWSAAEFGFVASVTYAVEMALTETFEDSAVLITTGGLAGSVLISEVNNALLAWELELDKSVTVKIRVKATVSDGVAPIYSVTSDFTATPYETLVDYPLIYLPGAYQGWNPGGDDGRLYSYESNSKYGGIVRIVDSGAGDAVANTEFKVTPAANWDNAWGGSLTPSGKNYSGSLDANGGNFSVAPGVYEFSVDTDALTIEMTKTDDWGIIGDATAGAWGSDTDMSYNGQRKMWEITTDLSVGEWKFRANDAWDLNLGSNDADGNLQGGGGNIPIAEAGNYTIRLDIANNAYKLIKN